MGHPWNGASGMRVILMNVLWVFILHHTVGFVAHTKNALRKINMKKRGLREEEKSKKKRDWMSRC